MRNSGRLFVIDGQFLCLVDGQDQMVTPEAEILDTAGCQSFLGGSHGANITTLGQSTFAIGGQSVDSLVDRFVFDCQDIVRAIPIAPDREIFMLPAENRLSVRRLQMRWLS